MATDLNKALLDDSAERKRLLLEVIDNFGIKANLKHNELPRGRGPIQPATIDDFFTILQKLIKKKQEVDGKQDKITFSHEYPVTEENPDALGEIITYRLIRREPGALAPTPFAEPRARRPVVFDVFDDPEMPNYKIFVLGWPFDNVVELVTWHKDHKVVERRSKWLEDLMLTFEWFFLINGIDKMFYLGRNEDDVVVTNRTKLACRPMRYFVRTQTIIPVREKVLEQLAVRIDLHSDIEE